MSGVADAADEAGRAALIEAGLARPAVIGGWPVPPPESAFAARPE